MQQEKLAGLSSSVRNTRTSSQHIHVGKFRPESSHFPLHIRTAIVATHFQLHTHEEVEVCSKILYQVKLNRGNLDTMWGFSVEAELVENSDKQDELCCYVSRVEERSVAMNNGQCALGLFFLPTFLGRPILS